MGPSVPVPPLTWVLGSKLILTLKNGTKLLRSDVLHRHSLDVRFFVKDHVTDTDLKTGLFQLH